VTSTALETVYREHFPFVWRVLVRLGVPEADLPDATQDVFMVVHQKLSDFDYGVPVTTWLYAICLRIASDRRRRAHVRHEVLTDVDHETEDADPAFDPDRRSQRALLDAALDALPLEQRSAFTLFELDGLSGDQIAELVGIPLSTVHSRLRLARATFQKAVARARKREAAALRKTGGSS
jgi:RNA polymerase sigma-70 factor, ECF subfamily